MSFRIRPFVLIAMLSAVQLAMWPAVAGAQRHFSGREEHNEHGFRGGRGGVILGGGFSIAGYFDSLYNPYWGPYAWGSVCTRGTTTTTRK